MSGACGANQQPQIETHLREIGERLAVPEAPDVTDAVLARLETPVRRSWWPARPMYRLAVVVVAALVALATAMAVSPTVRAAVFDLLRIGGVEIHQNEPPPPASSDVPIPGERTVSLDEARDAVDFPLTLPSRLGEPDSVLLAGTPPRVVSMRFGDVRIDQFDGGLDPMFDKFAMAEDVHEVTVAGVPGVWVDRPHVVLYSDRDGARQEAPARLAGSTLIWESGGITYRVEGDLTQAQALAIGESLR